MNEKYILNGPNSILPLYVPSIVDIEMAPIPAAADILINNGLTSLIKSDQD